jgi:uncharacterized protein DUF11
MRPRLALLTVLAVLVPASAAQAVTTVGSDLSKAANASVCGPAVACTYFTGDATTAAPVAAAPFDGVIVRWRVKAGSAAPSARLRVLRAAGSGSYTGVATGDSQALEPGTTNTFAVHIPVRAGDVIGLDDSSSAKVFASPATTAAYYFQPFLGAFAHSPSKQASRELLVNADIERDADGDGYGDETQDLCPTDETRQTACLSNLSVSVRPEPAPLTVGRPLSYTIKVSNDGPSTADDVGLTVAFPFSATPLQARAGRGFCGGSYTISCRLGPIERGDSGTVVLTVRPEVVGTTVVTGSATTPTAQTESGDDTFTSDVTVLPVTLRMLDLRLSHTSFRTGGSTAIKWYMSDAASVNVVVQQITRRGRHLPAGSFAVAGRQGSNVVRFRGRVPHRKRLRPGLYRFTVSAVTFDGRVATPGELTFRVRHRHGS